MYGTKILAELTKDAAEEKGASELDVIGLRSK